MNTPKGWETHSGDEELLKTATQTTTEIVRRNITLHRELVKAQRKLSRWKLVTGYDKPEDYDTAKKAHNQPMRNPA